MFDDLKKTISELNSNVNDVANCEKAKALRKKLLKIGAIMAVVGFGGPFLLLLLENIGVHMFRLLPVYITVPVFFFVGGIGVRIITLGLKIVITGYASGYLDKKLTIKCPYCDDPIKDGEIYCSKCGNRVKKECPSCKHINPMENDYCEKCGAKLD